MIIKFYKPYTPGIRQKTVLISSLLSFSKSKKTEKKLKKGFHRSKGRNNKGHITTRHKGGGHKRLYRIIDFKRNKYDILGKVATIEYDPNRNVNISLINYVDGDKRYILSPEGLKINMEVISTDRAPITIGNTLPLGNIPLGTEVHNIEFFPGKGGQVCRSAGTFAKIISNENNNVILRLMSKETRIFKKECLATIGKLGNTDQKNIKIGKAGRNRWLGIRPTVRGSAMNPVDHPHGGGEGRTSIGRSKPLTPWGKPALGVRTRKKFKRSNIFIINR